MDTRANHHTRRIALVAAALAMIAAAGCKAPGGGDAAPTSTAAPTPPPAAPTDSTGDVTRYGSAEIAETGSMTIRQPVPARKSADRFSAQVVLLQPGSAVTRIAQYGPFTLASWNNGTASGWVETAVALRSPVFLDGGIQQPILQPGQSEPAFFDGGIIAPQVVQPQVVQPQVPQPPVAQPPVAQPPPQPAAPPKPPLPGFKPPKLK